MSVHFNPLLSCENRIGVNKIDLLGRSNVASEFLIGRQPKGVVGIKVAKQITDVLMIRRTL